MLQSQLIFMEPPTSKNDEKRSNEDVEFFESVLRSSTVEGYRRIAKERDCAPRSHITDDEIFSVYLMILSPFQAVARGRGQRLSLRVLHNIIFFFLQKYELFGRDNIELFKDHVAYELQKFENEGLREEYNVPLKLF